MTDLNARVTVSYEIDGRAEGPDGFSIEFNADDSFRSWFSIVRWNLHYHHWRALRMNARDLFTKVIRRKLWRR